MEMIIEIKEIELKELLKLKYLNLGKNKIIYDILLKREKEHMITADSIFKINYRDFSKIVSISDEELTSEFFKEFSLL